VRRLVTAGLVEERRDEVDRRAVRVSLTEAGRALRPEAERVAAGMADAMGLAPDELVDFVTRLRSLTGRVTGAAGTPTAAAPREGDGGRT
jgi:DNA-binding MarR family transcriptional regulator